MWILEAVLGMWRISSEQPKVPTWVQMGSWVIRSWPGTQRPRSVKGQEIIHLGLQMNKGKGLPIFIQECQSSKRLK